MTGSKRKLADYWKPIFIETCRYVDWVSNIVLVEKIRVRIDFRDLNKATPNDAYAMPVADMLINEASRKNCKFPRWGHKV
jgi:hypothetical protein